MSRQVDVKALVSHIVRGDGGDKCRICMGDTTEGQVFLGDTVMLDGNKPVTLAELLETITGVAVSSDGDMPDALCMTCAGSAKEAGNFRIFCQEADNQWTRTLLLMESFPSPQYLPDNNKSIYFVMKDDEVSIINDLDDDDFEPDDPYIKPDDVYAQLGDDNVQDDVNNEPDDSDDLTNMDHSTKELEVRVNKMEYSENTEKMTCPDCGKTFKYPRLMLRHIENLTDPRRACFICTKVMSRESLVQHLIDYHDIQCYPCTKCPAIFQSTQQFFNHNSKAHKPGSHDCADCGRTFKSAYALGTHIGVHTAKNCPSCDKLFRNQMCYNYHVKHCGNLDVTGNDIQKTKTKVKYDGKNAKKGKNVEVGLRGTSKSDQDCYCDYCGKSFKRKNTISTHIQVVHLRNTHIPCPHCGKLFAKLHMNKHIKSHEETETFPCEKCGFVLLSKEGYKCHVRLHTGERPYTCKFCGEKFTSSSQHSTHVKLTHKSPEALLRHICNICQAGFTMMRGLRRHMAREHSKEAVIEKPMYECDICFKNFYSNNGVKNHKTRLHQPIQPKVY